MKRLDIINTVGSKYLVSNIENDEFSYAIALGGKENLVCKDHFKVDLRFLNNFSKTLVLIETKTRFVNKDEEQLFSYVKNEQKLNPDAKIIAMLADTGRRDKVRVWKVVNGKLELLQDEVLKTFAEYEDMFRQRNRNDRYRVLENTSKLNDKLHDNGIPEKLRSQFVGTCLLALKEGLVYKDSKECGLSNAQIVAGIREKLNVLLSGDEANKTKKVAVLDSNVLTNQKVLQMDGVHFAQLLDFIKHNILPYIDSDSYEGQDLLSYFFTTFNKYVAREDKNQAFTPNHIAHFMTKIGKVSKNTHVLDPTCGSATFDVQAMNQEIRLCKTAGEIKKVKQENIYGIESDQNVFGLATTNMLIHGDGNSNIYCESCFKLKAWIERAGIDLVLMNPPYNASKSDLPKDIQDMFGSAKTDPTKGFSFVEYVARCVQQNNGRLLTLLPMACAITTDGVIGDFKQKMLQAHTLDAVFSFPDDMFYPGASAVACCMVFDLNHPHPDDFDTFFGYFKNDGFEKRKGVGRVDVKEKWDDIEKEWLNLYIHRDSKPGMSVTKHVTAHDEWCAEAYMETDYSSLSDTDFIQTMQSYAGFLIQNEKI